MIYCADPNSNVLSSQNAIEEAVLRVLRGKAYILGEEVERLEDEFAAYIGCRFSVGVASGTDALQLALRAYGIGPGDEVITVSYTAVATVVAIEEVGATPVLVDVDDEFYTIDIEQVRSMINHKTKAVIAVHLFGQSAELDELIKICRSNNLILIEDASQAHGATYKGRVLGSVGDIGCFSCYPTKNLGAVGDAGLITTNNQEIAEKLKALREYGWKKRYISDKTGLNSRLDEIQAAILRVKLEKLQSDNQKRIEIAQYYNDNLADPILKPLLRSDCKHVYHLYVVQVANRSKILEFLNKKGIFPGIHYPLPIHQQPAYSERVTTSNNLKKSEKLSKSVISLPLYPELTSYPYIVDTINNYFGK